MGKKVLVATEKPFASEAIEMIRTIFEEAGYELRLLEKYKEKVEFLRAVSEVDALIVRSDKVDADVIESGENLKIVVRAGAGYDNLDLAASTKKGVICMNTPGQNSNAVAELAFGMMMYLARDSFSGKTGSELRGKRIGIHAYGNVGKYVAQIAKGFGMDVVAYDPFVDPRDMEKDGVKPVKTVEELYRTCDYISLHLPLIDATREFVDYRLMSMMKKGATLVNTARKEVINESDLEKIFAENSEFFYASDIAPACMNTLVEKYKGRCFFTPKKMGAQTKEANLNAGVAAAHQIVDFFEKGDTKFQVNK